MILKTDEFNLQSFLIVFIAFVGNAQIIGFDIVSLIIIPTYIFLYSQGHRKILRRRIAIFLCVLSVYSVILLRVLYLRNPYFDEYYIWPFKAVFLVLIVSFAKELKWPILNSVALGFVCLGLLLVGNFEGGRFVSVFGPNMLYRIFGFLMLFSLSNYFTKMNNHSRDYALTPALLALFGAFGSFITGSSGALVIIALCALVLLYQLKGFHMALIALIACAGVFAISGADLSWVRLSSIDRAIYKASHLAVDARLSGWLEIMSDPISILGRSYQHYSHLWGFGYNYPHNIFVELYAFFGIAGAFSIAIIIYACVLSLPLIFKGDTLSILFLVLLIGSMFSGDLSDNYGVLGVAGGLVVTLTGVFRSRRI